MLKEIKAIKQYPDESRRRWFYDDGMDLILWENSKGAITGFQITYDKPHDPHILTWTVESGYTHNRLDDGEHAEGMKDTPILISDGIYDLNRIASELKRLWPESDSSVFTFVYDRLNGSF